MSSLRLVFGVVLLCTVGTAAGINPAMIEADWLRQAESWREVSCGVANTVTTQLDASGAVDGVKDGRYAFHTGSNADPWWQVDLQQTAPISRIVIYNRLDYAPGLHNADTMRVFVSDNAADWTLVHDCAGKHFGGLSGAPPLDLTFDSGLVTGRYVRLQIASDVPLFLHLDEVEVYAENDANKNIAIGKPADQISLSQWSVIKKPPKDAAWESRFPVEETRARLRKFAAYLMEQQVNVDDVVAALDEVAGNEPREEYLRLRWLGRKLVAKNPLLDFDRLLFVKRYTQQTYPDVCLNHMPWVSRPGGDIYVLETPFSLDGSEQRLTPLINGQLGVGHVRGIDLWWDGDRIVFGYAQQENFPFPKWPIPVCEERLIGHHLRLSQEPIHLYEINADGTRLRQITDHEMWSDLDPAYLPNGDIVFVSERCGFSLQCNNGPFHDETSCNLYTVKPDGSSLRWLNYNKDGDYLPRVLGDGKIGYCRWEYQERGWATLHAIWSMRPDGTGADPIYKQHIDNPWAFESVREIPNHRGEERLLTAIGTGHHTLACGPICRISLGYGINDEAGIEIVTPGVLPPEGGMSGRPVPEGGCVENGGYYMDPWPISDQFFLAAYTYSNDFRPGSTDTFRGADETGYGLYLIDVFGNKELLYADPEISSSFPMPLRARKKPPILPDVSDPALGERAVCIVSDVTFGVDGVNRDEVKYLRVARRIGWPYTKETGGQRYEVDGSSWGLSWAPPQIYGEVPVESDGSASFYVPSNVAVYFQLLDADKREIKRMRSFISFQPGESRSCVGCHETRNVTPTTASVKQAMTRAPSVPIPPPWGADRCISYLADIQPVFDRHCVSCHAGLKPAAGLDFSGGLVAGAPMNTPYRQLNFDGLNRSYRTIIENNLITYSDKHALASELTQTRQFGSTRSRLVDAITTGTCASRCNIKPGSEDWYRLVTWIDANAPYHDNFVNSRAAVAPYDLPADKQLYDAVAAIHQRRCTECHTVTEVSRLDFIDLHAPESSRFLTAPLAKNAGGSGNCGESVYADANDPDYSTLQKFVSDAVQKAWDFPRRDLETLLKP